MPKKIKLDIATGNENADWIKYFDQKREGTERATEFDLHKELAKEKPENSKEPKKHLRGQHDQSSHGNWARGGHRVEMETGLTDYLKQMVSFRKDAPESLKYNSFEDLVLKNGRFFNPPSKGDELPEYCEGGEPKQCFLNSLRNMDFSGKYSYVEGYAISDVLEGYPFHHAWLVDSDDNVIDTTWESGNGLAYFGVKFDSTWVRKIALRDKISGIFHHGNFDLIEDGLPEDALPQSSKKHLAGTEHSHDQRTHGNWARGGAQVKFKNRHEAMTWFRNNEEWVGSLPDFYKISNESVVDAAETLASLKAMGMPGLGGYYSPATGLDDTQNHVRFKFYWDKYNSWYSEGGFIEVSTMGADEVEERMLPILLRASQEYDPESAIQPVHPISDERREAYKEWYTILEKGHKDQDFHSMYYFPDDKQVGATVRHEMGHFFHERYATGIGERKGINESLGKFKPTEKETIEYFAVTERAKENWTECIAENFVLYSIGREDRMQPEMVETFDHVLAWGRQEPWTPFWRKGNG